jgi:hypothetical protein
MSNYIHTLPMYAGAKADANRRDEPWSSVYLNHEPNQLLVSRVPSMTFLSNLSTAWLTSLRVLLNSFSASRLASSYFFLASTLYWSSFCSAFCASVRAWLAWRGQQWYQRPMSSGDVHIAVRWSALPRSPPRRPS